MKLKMKTIEEIPNILIHPEARYQYYQQKKNQVMFDFDAVRKLKRVSHYYRCPWCCEAWECLILFGEYLQLVKVIKNNHIITREFIT